MVTPAHGASPVDTRSRLIEAAVEVFAERGYEGTKVQDVARRAGLTTGAIYANFRDKNELLAEAVRLGAEELVVNFSAMRSGGASGVAVIEAMARQLAQNQGRLRRQVLLEGMGAARRDNNIADVMRDNVVRGTGHLIALIEVARSEGDIADDIDSEALARFAYALGFGYYLLETLGLPPPDDAAWTALVRRLIVGMRADEVAGAAAATAAAGKKGGRR
jgi:AcrR family transcriptional regulator